MRLILVRHGETIENKKRIVQGQIDGRLSRRGIRQAKKVARVLMGYDIDAFYSSDLARCLDTSKYIFKRRPDLRMIKERRLREIDFGIMQGKPSADMENKDFPGWGIFKEDFWHARVEGGESNSEMYRRVMGFVNELVIGKFKSVLLVTHGGPIRHIIAVSKGVDAAPIFGQNVANAEPIEVRINEVIELKH